jgi:hypothetical protein
MLNAIPEHFAGKFVSGIVEANGSAPCALGPHDKKAIPMEIGRLMNAPRKLL